MYHKHMMVILVPCMIFTYTSVTTLPCKCAPSEKTSRVRRYHKTKVCCLGFGPVKKPGKSACFACCPHGGGYWWLFPGSGPQESNIPPRPPPPTDGPVKTVACLTRLPARENWQQPGHEADWRRERFMYKDWRLSPCLGQAISPHLLVLEINCSWCYGVLHFKLAK